MSSYFSHTSQYSCTNDTYRVLEFKELMISNVCGVVLIPVLTHVNFTQDLYFFEY